VEARPDFRRAAGMFPVVGAAIGILGGVVLAIAVALGLPLLVAAAMAVIATILVTGALHEDGLADIADSFGGATPERRLEIMKDSRVGTYGAIALIFSILIRVAALASLADGGAYRAAFALVAAEAISRAAMVRLWHDLPPAMPGAGLSEEAGVPDQKAMLVALAVAVVIVLALVVPSIGFWAAVAGGVAVAIMTYIFMRLMAHAIGGRTGDALGGCQQLAAVAFLVAVAAF
jgi:adenosylcobinamide-GDP ribazoletransferase